MEFGIVLPARGYAMAAKGIAAAATAAESMGFNSIWMTDHLAFANGPELAHPYLSEHPPELQPHAPVLEAWSTLHYVAALTTKVRLGVSICIVPLRHPILLAKQLATLDFLSGGRAILGVGTGWQKEEVQAFGVKFEERGLVTDETLALLQAAWSTDAPVTFHGRYFDIQEMYLNPSPSPGRLPIWIGGHSRKAKLRAAQFGSAWIPTTNLSPDQIKAALPEICSFAGNRSLDTGLHVILRFAESRSQESLPWEKGTLVGSPSFVAEVLAKYQEAGVGHMVLSFVGDNGDAVAFMRSVERFTTQVRPQLQ